MAGPTHPTVDSRSYPSTVDICHLQAGCDACHCYRPIHAGEVGRETLGKDKIRTLVEIRSNFSYISLSCADISIEIKSSVTNCNVLLCLEIAIKVDINLSAIYVLDTSFCKSNLPFAFKCQSRNNLSNY